MTDRAGEIIERARALLVETNGEAPSEETLARFLAAQIIIGADLFCFGHARHGRPSIREPKVPHVQIDDPGTGQADG